MYQLEHYLDMMSDRHRMVPLEAAIRSAVRPGDVVVDLGAGTGVLTFIALDAGASHVYALEQSPAIEVARGVARANGLADRITFIHGDADAVKPSTQVDGLIGDIRGVLPLLGANIALFETVRRRWLKPGGYTVPVSDELIVAPVSAIKPRAVVDGWTARRPEADYASAAAVAANAFVRATFDPDDLLAEGLPAGSITYGETTPRKLAASLTFAMKRAGTLTGLGLWFRSKLTENIRFETSPHSPASVYGHAFFPLATPRSVTAGEAIEVTVTAHRMPFVVWGWKVSSTGSSPGQPSWQESHSTLKSYLFGPAGLSWLVGAEAPKLSEEGLLARHVLAAADGTITARQLAEQVVGAFPDRFPSVDDALPAVVKILKRYAAP